MYTAVHALKKFVRDHNHMCACFCTSEHSILFGAVHAMQGLSIQNTKYDKNGYFCKFYARSNIIQTGVAPDIADKGTLGHPLK